MPRTVSKMHVSNLIEPNMPTTSKEVDPLLAEAIQGASLSRLVSLVITLLRECEDAASLAEELLLTKSENVVSKKRRAEDTVEDTGYPAKKCKRYETCAQCEEEFDVLANTKLSCEWHPGKQTVMVLAK